MTFAEGFREYIQGEWEVAYHVFEKCLELNPKDGPTKTLMHYIEDYNLQAPDDWEGYRKLTSK